MHNINKTKRKKRILFLAAHFLSLYLTRRELIEELTDQGHEVYISLPDAEDNRFFKTLGCRIIPTPVDRRGQNPFADILLTLRYIRIIRTVRPDIILSYEIKPNIYGALANRFLKNPQTRKKYAQICNVTGTGAVFLQEDFTAKICRMLYRLSVRHARLVFFQNSADRVYFIKNNMVKEEHTGLLPGSGINLRIFTPKPYPPEEPTVNFIFIARVMRIKGLLEYLYAAETVKKEYPNTRFLIAGYCEEEKYLRIIEQYEERGVVEYISFRTDIIRFIEDSHCTVLPSHGGEGVPNVILESAALARPCIGSAIPGTVDVIKDGVNGFLFEPKNGDDLVAAMKKLLALSHEEKAAMGLKGREYVEQHFDRDTVISAYMDLVERSPLL